MAQNTKNTVFGHFHKSPNFSPKDEKHPKYKKNKNYTHMNSYSNPHIRDIKKIQSIIGQKYDGYIMGWVYSRNTP